MLKTDGNPFGGIGYQTMKPLSILQWIILKLGGVAVQYPLKCGVCRAKTKGNIITGFYMPCERLPKIPGLNHFTVRVKPPHSKLDTYCNYCTM